VLKAQTYIGDHIPPMSTQFARNMTMRASYVLILAGAAACATLFACGSGSDGIGSGTAASTESSLKDQLVGTWTDATYTTDGAPFQGITLNHDGTFSWTAPCVSQGVEDCLSVRTDSGNWKVGLSGPQLGAPAGAYQLKLTDQFGQESDYFVQASSGTMTLNTQIDLGQSYTFTMASSQPSVQTQLVGSWTDPTYTTDGAPFQGINLNQDGTFNWTAPCVSQGAFNCQSIRTDSGNWTVATSGPQLGAPAGAPQLKLVDQFNQESDYFVNVSSVTMTLSTAIDLGSSYTFTMGAVNEPSASGGDSGTESDGGAAGGDGGASGGDGGGSAEDGGGD
jgi:hypothetical protein